MKRDYIFYKNNINHFTFFGNYPPKIYYNKQGVDAKRAFFIFDTTGKIVSTKEPELFRDLIICKKSVNFHIKMWAEGYDEYTLLEFDINDIKQDYNCPEWVIKSIKNQAKKLKKKVNNIKIY
jgi:hypothetical protein